MGARKTRDGATKLTCHVGVNVVVQAAPSDRLAAKQRVAVKVVAEFLQEAEDVRDAADSGQSQGVLLLVEVGWAGDRGHNQSGAGTQRHAHLVNRLSRTLSPEMTSPPCPDLRQEKTEAWLGAESTQA